MMCNGSVSIKCNRVGVNILRIRQLLRHVILFKPSSWIQMITSELRRRDKTSSDLA